MREQRTCHLPRDECGLGGFRERTDHRNVAFFGNPTRVSVAPVGSSWEVLPPLPRPHEGEEAMIRTQRTVKFDVAEDLGHRGSA